MAVNLVKAYFYAMVNFFALLLLVTMFLQVVKSEYRSYQYTTNYFKQKVDHFGFANQDKFSQRYLVSDKYWNKTGGPIFLYAGNEGDITLFAQNTGFMWEIAPEFGAMIIFAEHRYYGKSLPYGKLSFQNTTYSGYLTSEQALADFADLLTYVRTSVKGSASSPVIVFGGSYGGMLAAWFRMKYPHIVQGAIAASAPILQFIGLTPCEKFGQLVTKDFANESPACADVIRKSWGIINKLTSTPDGMKWLNENWKLCQKLKTKNDVEDLKDFLTNVWTNLAMADYPYPASFLAPLPANPVKMVCNMLKHPNFDKQDFLAELFDGLSIYFNYTKTATCLDYQQDATSQLGDMGWDLQKTLWQTYLDLPVYNGLNWRMRGRGEFDYSCSYCYVAWLGERVDHCLFDSCSTKVSYKVLLEAEGIRDMMI